MRDKLLFRMRFKILECELEGMIAENNQRSFAEHAMAYVEDSFINLQKKFEQLCIEYEKEDDPEIKRGFQWIKNKIKEEKVEKLGKEERKDKKVPQVRASIGAENNLGCGEDISLKGIIDEAVISTVGDPSVGINSQIVNIGGIWFDTSEFEEGKERDEEVKELRTLLYGTFTVIMGEPVSVWFPGYDKDVDDE